MNVLQAVGRSWKRQLGSKKTRRGIQRITAEMGHKIATGASFEEVLGQQDIMSETFTICLDISQINPEDWRTITGE